jgi:hypothetical protein
MSEPRYVLQLPVREPGRLPEFVEGCLATKASLIAVVGEGCADMEDELDRLILGDASDESRFVTTTSHPGETLEEVLEFACLWADGEAQVVVVRL